MTTSIRFRPMTPGSRQAVGEFLAKFIGNDKSVVSDKIGENDEDDPNALGSYRDRGLGRPWRRPSRS